MTSSVINGALAPGVCLLRCGETQVLPNGKCATCGNSAIRSATKAHSDDLRYGPDHASDIQVRTEPVRRQPSIEMESAPEKILVEQSAAPETVAPAAEVQEAAVAELVPEQRPVKEVAAATEVAVVLDRAPTPEATIVVLPDTRASKYMVRATEQVIKSLLAARVKREAAIIAEQRSVQETILQMRAKSAALVRAYQDEIARADKAVLFLQSELAAIQIESPPAPDSPPSGSVGTKWTKEYDRCVRCGTKAIKHKGKGLCVNCESRVRHERKVLATIAAREESGSSAP